MVARKVRKRRTGGGRRTTGGGRAVGGRRSVVGGWRAADGGRWTGGGRRAADGGRWAANDERPAVLYGPELKQQHVDDQSAANMIYGNESGGLMIRDQYLGGPYGPYALMSLGNALPEAGGRDQGGPEVRRGPSEVAVVRQGPMWSVSIVQMVWVGYCGLRCPVFALPRLD